MAEVKSRLEALFKEGLLRNHEVALGNLRVAEMNRAVADEHVRKLEDGRRIVYMTCPHCSSFLQLFPGSQKCVSFRNENSKASRRDNMPPQTIKYSHTFDYPEI